MDKRPTSLTVIAWIIIIGALFALYSSFTLTSNPYASRMLEQSPFPVSVHVGFSVLGAILTAIAGYGVLKGYPWSRWLYIGWSIVSLVFALVTVPIISVLVISVLFLIVVVFFLFRPAANDWFSRVASA
jgi:hypothetical protein